MPRPPYQPPLVTSSRFPLGLAKEQDQVPIVDAEWSGLEFSETLPLVALNLGGIVLAFHGGDAELGAALRELFPTYVHGGDAPDPVHVSLRGVSRRRFPTPVAFVSSAERGGQVLAKLRGVTARFDLAAARVVAQVETRCLAQDLANLVRFCLWAFAPRHQRFLVHAAAIEIDGEAILVIGAAQSGKSTVARLAAPRLVLSDDCVLLWVTGDRAYAATVGLMGSEGSSGLSRDCPRRELAVRAMVTLTKGVTNRVAALGVARAALEMQCTMSLLSPHPAVRAEALVVAEQVVRRVRRLALTFSKNDASFWPLLEDASRA